MKSRLSEYEEGVVDGREESAETIRQQQAEIEALKEVNTKQVDYIAEQKSAYEKLWSEHMELFWKHEKDVEEEQEK